MLELQRLLELLIWIPCYFFVVSFYNPLLGISVLLTYFILLAVIMYGFYRLIKYFFKKIILKKC